jgi:asparagine synthase (glutamine-hydrolysing)
MCGIAGFNWQDKSLIEKMTQTMRHRGPDDEGFYIDENVSLGHRRLSVIDISVKGHQPMKFENLVIVYNGEIYNFKQIREQLKDKGYNFISDTDTEVVLKSFHRWGPSCVNRFNGMWAFCIYDRQKKLLFLSRDRFGKKPLYYYFDGSQFIFASSLKAISRHSLNFNISTPALNFFFYQKYIGNELTIFDNCYKIRPSENLLFDLSKKKLTLSKYYNLEDQILKCQDAPLEQRVESIEDIIVSAVEDRLIADVPVGSFLSGGIDSSLISAIISSKHKDFDTFSIGFLDESYDELKYSKLVSEHIHTHHHYDYLEVDESLIKFIIENMDEPFGDASVLPTYLLSKITRSKVTVSLSGDAGDEIFGGYDTYKAYKLARYIPGQAIRFSRGLVGLLPASEKKVTLSFRMKRFVRDLDTNINRRHLNWMATFTDSAREKLLGDNFLNAVELLPCGSEDNLLSIQLNDIHNYLSEDILKKVDFASMLNSLEVRAPFLDYRLVPLVLSLPEKYKIRYFTTKWLLKRVASGYIPKSIVHRPKRGFTVPISRWIKKSDLIQQFLTGRKCYEHNLLSYDYIQELFNAHITNKEDNARQLWLVFVFNYWMSVNIIKNPA